MSSVQHFSAGTKLTTVQRKKKCYYCGQTFHDQRECIFRGEDCHHCGNRGYLVSVCRLKEWQESQKPKYFLNTKWVTSDERKVDHVDDPEHLPIYTIKE